MEDNIYDKLLREAIYIFTVSWDEFKYIDSLRTRKLIKKIDVIAGVIFILFWVCILIRIFSGVNTLSGIICTTIVCTVWVSYLYFSYHVWKSKYINKLLLWDNTIINKRFNDVICGRVEPMIRTEEFKKEVTKLKALVLDE